MYLDDVSPPPTDTLIESAHAMRSLARANSLSRYVPQLTLRFTHLSATTAPGFLYDSRADAWQWPMHLGTTIEIRLVWGLDGWIIPPISMTPSVWGWP
jgi:hypothetical protein